MLLRLHKFGGDQIVGARAGLDFCQKVTYNVAETADKGFWKAIWMWMLGVRHWEITKDFYFSLKGEEYVIPQGFQFDGASVPKFLAMWLSPTGVLLMGGLIHDYGYKYGTLLRSDRTTIGDKSQKWMDTLFRDVCIEQNGFVAGQY